jgi:hypothetical protein
MTAPLHNFPEDAKFAKLSEGLNFSGAEKLSVNFSVGQGLGIVRPIVKHSSPCNETSPNKL